MCLMPEAAGTSFLCSSCSLKLPPFCLKLSACDLTECCARTRGIFGQRLEDTVQYERKYGPRLAPLLVEQCVDFIRERGLTEEGLFRMPGQANLVKDLQDSFDCGEKPLFDSTTDVHTVASLLKLYLRELPEPVIPFAKYDDFLSCAQLLSKDETEGTLELAKQVKNLPQANYNLLKYICKFLDEVQAHSNINKMSVQNLATVFGPNILRPKKEDPVTIMEGTSLVQHLMTILISKHSQLFSAAYSDASSDVPSDTPVPKPEVKSAPPRSAAEWILEEHVEEGWKETNSPGLTDGPSKRTSSLDSATVGTLPKPTQERISRRTQICPNKAATSPSKKVQTLPNWKYSFRQSGAKSGSPKLVSSSLDINTLPSSGNWLMNGLSSLRGHRRTSSGDRAKDSNLPQRLSTYDNVPSGSPSTSAHSVASMAWSTSSCEISVVDSVNNCPVCYASGSSPCNSARFEWPSQGSPASSNDIKPTELGDSTERLAVCVSTLNGSSSEGNNFNTMSRDSVQCSHALQSLVTELKAELSKQKTEYETSLRRIEEASSGLKKQMARLEEDLDQERKKFTMLEIRLRNSERAREDAEKRNQLLQKEMEEFFSTLGTLTLGSRGTKVPK